MPPKKSQPKKISFENEEDDKLIKKTTKSTKQTKLNKKENKFKGGFKDTSSDSDGISESDDEESEVEIEEHYDEIEDDDALENDNEIDEEDEKNDSENEDEDEDEEIMNDDGDDCMYKFTKKKSLLGDDDDIDEGDYYYEEDEKTIENIFVPNDKRITKPVLTKYERVRILGERAKQLSLNAKPMIKNVENLDPKEIAKLELKMGVIPIIIIRPLPTGQKERWKISELKIVN